MAEYLLRHFAQRWNVPLEARSAGIYAAMGDPATPETLAVLKELGIDASAHRSQFISWELLDWADVVLTMTVGQKEHLLSLAPELQGKVFTLTEFVGANGEVPDPYGTMRAAYRKVRDQLAELVAKLVKKLQASEEISFHPAERE
jgi:protein-tyrosine phosphatase